MDEERPIGDVRHLEHLPARHAGLHEARRDVDHEPEAREAAGIGDGLHFGDNAKSALLTRALVEMTRFGVALGADHATFAGLAGLGDLITTLPVGPEHPGRTVGPSFELFYEDDDLLPHRESAWVLLEERVRDAATFCAAVTERAPEDVANAMGAVQGSLTGVADSLARHFADWGATSRFETGAGAVTTEEEPMHFDDDIKPLFREGDRNSMRFAWRPFMRASSSGGSTSTEYPTSIE